MLLIELALEDSAKRVDRAIVDAVVRSLKLNNDFVFSGVNEARWESAAKHPATD